MSTKDAAKAMMAGKVAETAAALDNIGKTKKRTKKERTGGGFGLSWVAVESNDPAANSRPKVKNSVAAKYLDDLMSIASEATSADGMSKDQLAAESAKALGQAKPRKIKSKYDIELEQLDAEREARRLAEAYAQAAAHNFSLAASAVPEPPSSYREGAPAP
jgi:hypothetical protein